MPGLLQKIVFGSMAALGFDRRFRRRHRGKAAILMYHSIVDHPPLAWTQVHVEQFRRQMAYLRHNTNVLSIPELVEGLHTDSLPPGATAVTFDDGFKNFATLALPVLEKYQIPAMVYLTTSFIDDDNEFEGFIWPDYVHAILLATKHSFLDLTDMSLPSLDLASTAARHHAKSVVCDALKRLPTPQRLQHIRTLASRTETGVLSEHRQMFAGMRWEDVRRIDTGGLIEFGAHTVNHAILSQTSEEAMRREILDSQRIIAEQLDHAVEHFAYPNGGRADYNEAVLAVVRDAFASAVVTTEGLATPQSPLHELPRLGVGSDMFESKFRMFVSGVMEGRR